MNPTTIYDDFGAAFEVLVANPDRSIVPHVFVRGPGMGDTSLCGAPWWPSSHFVQDVRREVCARCVTAWRRDAVRIEAELVPKPSRRKG